jgi:hypothetical protein
MTGATLYVVSALVSALLVGLAWLLGFRQTARIADAEAALALVAKAEPDFIASGDVVLDKSGKAALVRGVDGAFCTIRVLGDGLTVRRFGPGTASISEEAGRLVVTSADLGFPKLVLERP